MSSNLLLVDISLQFGKHNGKLEKDILNLINKNWLEEIKKKGRKWVKGFGIIPYKIVLNKYNDTLNIRIMDISHGSVHTYYDTKLAKIKYFWVSKYGVDNTKEEIFLN